MDLTNPAALGPLSSQPSIQMWDLYSNATQTPGERSVRSPVGNVPSAVVLQPTFGADAAVPDLSFGSEAFAWYFQGTSTSEQNEISQQTVGMPVPLPRAAMRRTCFKRRASIAAARPVPGRQVQPPFGPATSSAKSPATVKSEPCPTVGDRTVVGSDGAALPGDSGSVWDDGDANAENTSQASAVLALPLTLLPAQCPCAFGLYFNFDEYVNDGEDLVHRSDPPATTEDVKQPIDEVAVPSSGTGEPIGTPKAPNTPAIVSGENSAGLLDHVPVVSLPADPRKALRDISSQRQEEIRRAIYTMPMRREPGGTASSSASGSASPGPDTGGTTSSTTLTADSSKADAGPRACAAETAKNSEGATGVSEEGAMSDESARYYRELKRWASGPGGVPRYIKVAMTASPVDRGAAPGAADAPSEAVLHWDAPHSEEPTAATDTVEPPDPSEEASASLPLSLPPPLEALIRAHVSGANRVRDTVSVRRRRRERRRERQRNRRVRIKLASESSMRGDADEEIMVIGKDGQPMMVSAQSAFGEGSVSSGSGTVCTGGAAHATKRIGRGFNFPPVFLETRKGDLPSMCPKAVERRESLLAQFREGTPPLLTAPTSPTTSRHSRESFRLPPIDLPPSGAPELESLPSMSTSSTPASSRVTTPPASSAPAAEPRPRPATAMTAPVPPSHSSTTPSPRQLRELNGPPPGNPALEPRAAQTSSPLGDAPPQALEGSTGLSAATPPHSAELLRPPRSSRTGGGNPTDPKRKGLLRRLFSRERKQVQRGVRPTVIAPSEDSTAARPLPVNEPVPTRHFWPPAPPP